MAAREEDDRSGGLTAAPLRSPPRLSRSPHPYHRQSVELPDAVYNTAATGRAPGAPVRHVATAPADYFYRAASKPTTSPSDSGTEADDERPLLKALTAPPLRPRKGLKTVRSDSYTTPLPTPSLADEAQAFATTPTSPFPGPEVHTSKGAAASKKARAASSARRRAALARRVIEVGLLVAITVGSFRGASADTKKALLFQVVLASASHALSAIHRLVKAWSLEPLRLHRLWSLASLDPALAIYPLLIPATVAASLTKEPDMIYVNLMLGLCAMPIQAVPFQSFHLQWIITILPYAYRERCLGSHHSPISVSDTASQASIYLFPLHYCLKSCLEYLTSTSLLPTEVELLSASLIGLLLYADSPQTYILKSLLWIGGIGLFLTCKDVLKWTVSLARVPSWKFRKIFRPEPSSRPILTAVDEALGGWLTSFWLKDVDRDSSDSDEITLQPIRKQIKHARSGSSHEKRRAPSIPLQNGTVNVFDDSPGSAGEVAPRHRSRKRRHTLPTSPSALYDLPQLSRTATNSLARFRNQPKYYPSLTLAQARILKWIYAAFVYFMVVVTILGPIRIYVAHRALQGEEPIGWALGYALGNIEPFRDRVELWGLSEWICLPEFDAVAEQGGILSTFGQANMRLAICAYCVLCILAGLLLVSQLSQVVEVDTRRKVFHGMMVVMFGVTTFIDPTFIALALSLVLAVFLLLDLFRAGQLPPISRPLTIFLAPYVDGRDHKGPVVISPIFLLIGCAIPLWLSLGSVERLGSGAWTGWEVAERDLSMVTGVVCVGMGDAAASLVGRRYGRRRWPWGGGKSIEGSAAFAVAVVLGLVAARMYLALGPWSWDDRGTWAAALGKAAVAASAASLTETVLTGANDNVLVPVTLWLWVRAVGL